MESQVIGDWFQEATLGSGGFGMVVLWRNKITNKAIAIKKCRWTNDPMLTAKHKQRWELEVQIMRKLQHPNVVTALPVPSELDVNPTDMPVLAMEYCTKGDLRKVLNIPENCCGLGENKLRNLIRDISCAVNFLHSMRIIHRDLKPENVVVQDVDGKTVYKLTDLGYAKELDQGSVCTSFVGTLQYLAPELFLSQQYTCTVDYWSLGLVAHEAMLGVRPFLPNLAPAEWMKYVCKKKPNDICVYLNSDGAIQFSKHIFSENHLSKPFTEYLEKWLGFMLEWNPQRRGIDSSNGVKKYLAFSMLEDILKKKIIHLFYVKTGQVFSYEINENTSVNDVLTWLLYDVGGSISLDDFECYLPRGVLVDRTKSATQMYCAEPDENEDWLIYVFVKSNNKKEYSIENIFRKKVSSVERMLSDERCLFNYEDQKRIWAHSVYFTDLELILNRRYLAAYKVLMTHLVKCNSHMMRLSSKMISEMNKLNAKLEYFKGCLTADKIAYDQAKKSGLSSTQMEKSLMCDSTVAEIEKMQNSVLAQESKVNAVNSKTLSLQQSFFIKSNASAVAEKFYRKAMETYTALKKKTKDERRIPSDNLPMLTVIKNCTQQRDEQLRQYFIHLHKVEECKKEIVAVLSPCDKIIESIQKLSQDLLELQITRQNIVWKALTITISRQKGKQPVSDAPSLSSRDKLDFATPSLELNSLSSILSKNSEDSISAIQENQRIRTKWRQQFDSISKNMAEEFDWEYLKQLTKNS